MKLHFEMPFSVEGLPEDVPASWTLSFTYDYDDSEITFDVVDGDDDVPGDRYEGIQWLDFLKIVEKPADGDFVNNLYKLAESHVDLNLDEALRDYYQQD